VSDDREGALSRGLQKQGLKLAREQIRKLVRFAELVIESNQTTNLTGVKSVDRFLVEQVLDSLSVLTVLKPKPPIVDVGSGAGLPGIPIAIAQPDRPVILLEPRAKRAEFLRGAIERLEIGNARVVQASVLGPGAQSLAGSAGTALLRAVAQPERAVALGAALVRTGGEIILYQGREPKPDRSLAKRARLLGFGPWSARAVHIPGLGAPRHLWWARRLRSEEAAKRSP
jgi:16S rRNA (guanine527-N7)-methyltransferase